MDYKKLIDEISAYNFKTEQLYSEWAKLNGMSYYAFMVLYVLGKNQPCTQKFISEELLLPKQTVNTVIKDLIKKGFAELSAGRNQKEKLVLLTADGIFHAEEVMAETYRLEEKILRRMGKKECLMIIQSTIKFAEIFEEELHEYRK